MKIIRHLPKHAYLEVDEYQKTFREKKNHKSHKVKPICVLGNQLMWILVLKIN